MKALQFLQKHGQAANQVDADTQIKLFIDEMNNGMQAHWQCLPMIPTFLYNLDRSAIKEGKRILIDAGGTNFRSAVGYFEKGKIHVEKLQKTVMPGADGKPVSKQEFYGTIANNIAYLADDAVDVGFCFSYAVNMGSDLDGEVFGFSKEIKAPEVVGTRVGAETLAALKKYSDKQRKIVILNDTVATLLGGMALSEKQYSTYLGYIYGTGTNVCCIADAKDITKYGTLPQGKMLVNMECGGYNGFVMGDFDKAAVAATDNPQSQLFEKMTSGKYLSDIIYQALCAAKREGCFVGNVQVSAFALKDVSAFLQNQGQMCEWFKTDADRQFAGEICTELIKRAAKMGAIANAATAIATCTDKSLPVAIVCEGTTFHKLVGYRSNFEGYLKEILDAHGITFEILQGEDLNLVGTLMATMALA